MGEVEQYVGKFYSLEWVRKNILQMSEEEIRDMNKQIKIEQEEEDNPMNDEEPEDDVEEEGFEPVEMSEEDRALISKMTSLLENVELGDDEDF
jgi:hypothetical protein